MDSIINFLLTEREVCTEKYRNEDFLRKDRARIGRGLYKKPRPLFFVHTEKAMLIKNLLYGIYT